ERLADGSPRRAIQENGARIFRALGAAASRGAAFAVALVLISVVRETLGSGTITLFPLGAFGGTIVVSGISAAPARALLFAGGGFLCLGYLAGLVRLAGRLRNRRPRAAGEAGAQ
ncbi:MAG TPA: hypothetical protein VL359_10400, partial [bacterium]|nr:hypothetical protein [bacterium]